MNEPQQTQLFYWYISHQQPKYDDIHTNILQHNILQI